MTEQAPLTQHRALYDGRARLMSGLVSCQSQFHLISLGKRMQHQIAARRMTGNERLDSRFGRIPWRVDARVGVSRLHRTKTAKQQDEHASEVPSREADLLGRGAIAHAPKRRPSRKGRMRCPVSSRTSAHRVVRRQCTSVSCVDVEIRPRRHT